MNWNEALFALAVLGPFACLWLAKFRWRPSADGFGRRELRGKT